MVQTVKKCIHPLLASALRPSVLKEGLRRSLGNELCFGHEAGPIWTITAILPLLLLSAL
jgi:hypothetical protein